LLSVLLAVLSIASCSSKSDNTNTGSPKEQRAGVRWEIELAADSGSGVRDPVINLILYKDGVAVEGRSSQSSSVSVGADEADKLEVTASADDCIFAHEVFEGPPRHLTIHLAASIPVAVTLRIDNAKLPAEYRPRLARWLLLRPDAVSPTQLSVIRSGAIGGNFQTLDTTVPAGKWRLLCIYDDWVQTDPRVIDVSPDDAGKHFVLRPEYRERVWGGSVLDAETLEAVAAAKLSMPGHAVTTDVQGAFTIREPGWGPSRTGDVALEVLHTGYDTQSVTVPSDGRAGLRILLKPHSPLIKIRVLDKDSGTPIPRAKLTLRHRGESELAAAGMTGESGILVLRVESGRYALTAEAEGYSTYQSVTGQNAYPFLEHRNTAYDLYLSASGSIHVAGPEGCSGAFWALPPTGDAIRWSGPRFTDQWPQAPEGRNLLINGVGTGNTKLAIAQTGYFPEIFELYIGKGQPTQIEYAAATLGPSKACRLNLNGVSLHSSWVGDGVAKGFPTRGKCLAFPGYLPLYAAREARRVADLVPGDSFVARSYPFSCSLVDRDGVVELDASRGATVVSPTNQVVYVQQQDTQLVLDKQHAQYGVLEGKVDIQKRLSDADYLLVACKVDPADPPRLGTDGLRAAIDDKGNFRLVFVPPGHYVVGVVRVSDTELSWDHFDFMYSVDIKADETSTIVLS